MQKTILAILCITISCFSCEKDLTSNFDGIWKGRYTDSDNVVYEDQVVKIESVSNAHLIIHLPDGRVIGSDAFNNLEFSASDATVIIKGYYSEEFESLGINWQDPTQSKFYNFSGKRL